MTWRWWFGLLLAASLCAQAPGPLPDGSGTLLNTGWVIQPAGRLIPLGDFPLAAKLTPNGRFLVVMNAGEEASLSVLETGSFREVSRTRVPAAWLGMSFTVDGGLLYVSGGSAANIQEFALSADGALERRRTFPVASDTPANERDFVGDVALSPDGRLIYATLPFRNQVIVVNPQSGWVIERFETGRRPYRLLFHPDGQSLFVTSWADGSLHHHRASDGEHLGMIRLGAQPMDMVFRGQPIVLEQDEAAPPWKARIYVAVANTNTIQVVGVTESKTLSLVDTIRVQTWPWQPLGMTPSALALTADGSRLYVACSDNNSVGVVDVSRPVSTLLGYLPAGWYPTDVATVGDRVVVLNGKGEGSAQVVDPFDEPALFQYTKTVLGLSPYGDDLLGNAPVPEGNPVPPGSDVAEELQSPVRHVLYIVKGNRSFDEVLGNMQAAEADPKLVRFGADVTPNHHKLARDYVLFDNFHANGDGQADGWLWSTAAIASPLVRRLPPGRGPSYDYEGGEPAAIPPAAYLWTQAASAELSLRNYGISVENGESAGAAGEQVARVKDPILDPVTDRAFRGFDPAYPDAERARVFLADLARMEESGDMPRLMLMRLGNDGTPEGVADNDRALGMIVEAATRSKFWPRMAIFVLETDASGGNDHVSRWRAPAFIISPYTKRAGVDSTFYNTASMLRTIELILGLRPMTQFDAAAEPMWRAFETEADLTPYEAERPEVLTR